MKASIKLNKDDKLALFYEESFSFDPEWASIDIQCGEIYVGEYEHGEGKHIKLNPIEPSTYSRIANETEILLVQVEKDPNGKQDKLLKVKVISLMIAQEL